MYCIWECQRGGIPNISACYNINNYCTCHDVCQEISSTCTCMFIYTCIYVCTCCTSGWQFSWRRLQAMHCHTSRSWWASPQYSPVSTHHPWLPHLPPSLTPVLDLTVTTFNCVKLHYTLHTQGRGGGGGARYSVFTLLLQWLGFCGDRRCGTAGLYTPVQVHVHACTCRRCIDPIP